MCTRFDSEVNSHTSTRKLVTTLIFCHLTSNQYTKTYSLISEDFALEVLFQRYDVMRTL